MPEEDYAPPQKRSILIAGHPTSISLEPAFWRALEAAARERGCPINALVAEIDAEPRIPARVCICIRRMPMRRML